MSDIKKGDVVRLKSDAYENNKRYFTVNGFENGKVCAVGFNLITQEFMTIKAYAECFVIEE